MINRLRGSLACLVLLAASPAFADIGLYGLMNLGNASSVPRTLPPSSPFSGKTGWGGGMFFRGSSNPVVNFEVNVDYVSRKLDGGSAGDISFNMLEVPAFLRFTLPVITFAVGGYYAMRLGNPTSSTGAFAGSFNTHDFGLAAAAGVDYSFGPAGLFAEVRYLFGLANMDPQPLSTLYWRNWQFLAGVKFGF